MSSSGSSSSAGGEEQFVRIFDPIAKKPVGFLSSDSTLPINKLAYRFPGVLSLEYKNEEDGLDISVDFDDAKKAFVAPPGGWKGKTFNLVFKDRYERKECRSATPMPMGIDSNFRQVTLPEPDFMKKYCFYIPNIFGGKDCVTAIHPNYFVTFRHGSHLAYKDEDVIEIYSDDGTQIFNSIVKLVHDIYDFVILKSDRPIIPVSPPICNSPCPGQPIRLCGRGNSDSSLTWLDGCIHKEEEQLSPLGRGFGPFSLGSINTAPGDSGASIWDSHGLVGLNLGVVGFSVFHFMMFCNVRN